MHDFQLFASIDDEADLEGDTYVAATLLLPQQGQGIQNTFTDILQSISALQLGRYSPPTNPFKIPFFFSSRLEGSPQQPFPSLTTVLCRTSCHVPPIHLQ